MVWLRITSWSPCPGVSSQIRMCVNKPRHAHTHVHTWCLITTSTLSGTKLSRRNGTKCQGSRCLRLSEKSESLRCGLRNTEPLSSCSYPQSTFSFILPQTDLISTHSTSFLFGFTPSSRHPLSGSVLFTQIHSPSVSRLILFFCPRNRPISFTLQHLMASFITSNIQTHTLNMWALYQCVDIDNYKVGRWFVFLFTTHCSNSVPDGTRSPHGLQSCSFCWDHKAPAFLGASEEPAGSSQEQWGKFDPLKKSHIFFTVHNIKMSLFKNPHGKQCLHVKIYDNQNDVTPGRDHWDPSSTIQVDGREFSISACTGE